MASPAQIAANRRNALASTGPRTAEGKAAARFNAIKSGIHAVEQIIPGEDPADFDLFARELTETCRPANAREQFLVDQMIAHGWRLRRLLRAEPQAWTRIFDLLHKASDFSGDTALADGLLHQPGFFPRLQRLIASVQRSYHQAAADLDRLQSQRERQPPESEASHPGPRSLTPGPIERSEPTPPATIVVTPYNGSAQRRSEADHQSAENCLSHEGQPAADRAEVARTVGEG